MAWFPSLFRPDGNCDPRVPQYRTPRVHGENMEMDFSYIDDIADGFIRATFSEQAKNETFNITRGQTRTLLEAAKIIQTLVPGSTIETLDKNILFPKRGAFDITKAKKLLGYDPKIDLPEGIKIYFDHMLLWGYK